MASESPPTSSCSSRTSSPKNRADMRRLSTALQHAQTRARTQALIIRKYHELIQYGLLRWMRRSIECRNEFRAVSDFAAPLILLQHGYEKAIDVTNDDDVDAVKALTSTDTTVSTMNDLENSSWWQMPAFPMINEAKYSPENAQILSAYFEDVRSSTIVLPPSSSSAAAATTATTTPPQTSSSSSWTGVMSYEQLVEGCVLLGTKLKDTGDKLTALQQRKPSMKQLGDKCTRLMTELAATRDALRSVKRSSVIQELYQCLNRTSWLYHAHLVLGILVFLSSTIRRAWYRLWGRNRLLRYRYHRY